MVCLRLFAHDVFVSFYLYKRRIFSVISLTWRNLDTWKIPVSLLAGQISCFGANLAKISWRTCDRDLHLFQGNNMRGGQGPFNEHVMEARAKQTDKAWDLSISISGQIITWRRQALACRNIVINLKYFYISFSKMFWIVHLLLMFKWT